MTDNPLAWWRLRAGGFSFGGLAMASQYGFYEYDGKIWQFYPAGLELALLREPNLWKIMGVSRQALHKWRWGKGRPKKDKIADVMQYAPECLKLVGEVQ